jgi:glucokinase
MDGDHIAGIDLGGTKILSVCLDPSDAVVGRDYRETLAIEGPDAVIARMAESARAAADGRSLRAAGISTPGPVDLKRGLVTTPPNLPGWQDVALGYLIAQRLGVPAWIENDANAAALAEQRLGAGEGSNHMLLVTIGTGVGGGLVLDGRLYHGASGGAGEIGHMLVEPGGRLCGCGARGHLEAMASGRALNADAQELANVEPKGHVAEIARREGVTPDARILDMAAEAGDVSAREAIQRAGAYLGAGLTNLVNVFNPEVIVIGGSIRKSELYMESALTVLHRDAFRQHLADVRITEALLGDEAPAIGAALVAQDHLSSQRQG